MVKLVTYRKIFDRIQLNYRLASSCKSACLITHINGVYYDAANYARFLNLLSFIDEDEFLEDLKLMILMVDYQPTDPLMKYCYDSWEIGNDLE